MVTEPRPFQVGRKVKTRRVHTSQETFKCRSTLVAKIQCSINPLRPLDDRKNRRARFDSVNIDVVGLGMAL